jgi:hypothetical protein
MKETFTPNHLLLAAYGELAPTATELLQQEVYNNDTLNDSLQEIVDVQLWLDELQLQPSATSVNAILEALREPETAA